MELELKKDTLISPQAEEGDSSARKKTTKPGPVPSAEINHDRVEPAHRANANLDATSDQRLDEEEFEPNAPVLISALRTVTRTLVSSLTRRIVLANLVALAVLLSTILYLNQFREGLIDARVESLLTQGRIIADAISVSATVDTNTITIDPEKLLELQTGETAYPNFDLSDNLDYPINPEKIALVLRELIQPTRTRARIYDPEGTLVLDSLDLYAGSQVQRIDLPSVNKPKEEEKIGMIKWIGNTLNQLLQRRNLPLYEELQGTDRQYPEVSSALYGSPTPITRMTKKGELIVSVAVPIQRFRVVRGVLLLSTQGGDIDRIVAEERLAILRIFLVAAIVMIVLSILLASTIANPLRKLAAAAVRVRHGVNSKVEIPDFSSRQDEIGNLSAALGDMTKSLYARIAAIESFAADVSHELKNPLTSLRSAVETLPLAKTDAARDKLLEIIQHDVQRLDRLITDISDASRLDAELGREDTSSVDLELLLSNIVEASIQAPGTKQVKLKLTVRPVNGNEKAYLVNGHQSRLGQVINNLLDNAKSFVPETGGEINIEMERVGKNIRLVVEDNGPGIQAENRNRVFERFYTDRPDNEAFGQNSGLGLSISRQIVEAHGGRIRAGNRTPPQHGARFTITLPIESP